ncbi:probable 6-phosphogluconolactonase 1, partial [Gossypium hirsutum]|uniref:Probable 6-phosphogluconolactonase 1 n=1 Tax=Gossypium hirsutum TaxID=3635 RepID=A0ABM2ZXN5_GOSHI
NLKQETVKAPYKKTIGWSKWHIFWADERVVAKNKCTDCSQPSSFHQRFSFGRGSCRRIHVCYTLASKNTSVSVSDISDCPKLDLILLGIGPDHHVASLCSNHSALNETDKWVTFIIDSPKPPPERITFTFPVIKPKLSI